MAILIVKISWIGLKQRAESFPGQCARGTSLLLRGGLRTVTKLHGSIGGDFSQFDISGVFGKFLVSQCQSLFSKLDASGIVGGLLHSDGDCDYEADKLDLQREIFRCLAEQFP